MSFWLVEEDVAGQIIRPVGEQDTALESRVIIRAAELSDLSEIMLCEEMAWEDANQRASIEQQRERIRNHKEGFLVALLGNHVVGMVTFKGVTIDWERREFPKHSVLSDHGTIRSHSPLSETLFTVNICAVPEGAYPHMPNHVGAALAHAGFAFARKRGYRYVFGVGNMPGFAEYKQSHPEVLPERYIHLRNQDGSLVDPLLNFYESIGLKSICLARGLFEDSGSENNNVIMRWDNPNIPWTYDPEDALLCFHVPEQAVGDFLSISSEDLHFLLLKCLFLHRHNEIREVRVQRNGVTLGRSDKGGVFELFIALSTLM